MKECKRLKCPKNKGLQGFARVRKRAKALPDTKDTQLKKCRKIKGLRTLEHCFVANL